MGKRRPQRPADGPAANPAAYVALAEIGAAHGVRGAARIRIFAEDPDLLTECGPLRLADGRPLAIAAIEAQGNKIVARFEGVADRTEVEALRNQTLYLAREMLPDLDDEDTFYHVDLIGLDVVDTDGTALGRVRTVQDFGAGDLIEVERTEGKSVFVPFTLACVPTVDLAAGRIVVEPPVGLLEDGGDADEDAETEDDA
ncbi:ribosome maturation factor RimM [Amorphus orientalis]|uniref:Ribosome maturation factor RimM n=1 Tax=Amorphus orientalis TaxID=649198 RepID=A0AAE4AQG8_9HYPH|nr:ribosome maturation factor RimM [Amorphus orientalis]MDQ0314066.1 16S rRNA processing protein RimM [Amorphus orientalis]